MFQLEGCGASSRAAGSGSCGISAISATEPWFAWDAWEAWEAWDMAPKREARDATSTGPVKVRGFHTAKTRNEKIVKQKLHPIKEAGGSKPSNHETRCNIRRLWMAYSWPKAGGNRYSLRRAANPPSSSLGLEIASWILKTLASARIHAAKHSQTRLPRPKRRLHPTKVPSTTSQSEKG